MIRDFTEDTKERLLEGIEENRSDWDLLTDIIGDAVLHVGKWIGILSLQDDMYNVESYQKKVVDMANMTRDEINQIFIDVNEIDKNYKECISQFNEAQELYNSRLKILDSIIEPNFRICSSKEIKARLKENDNHFKNINAEVDKMYNKELDKAEKRALINNAKGFVKSTVGFAVDVILLPAKAIKATVTGDIVQYARDTKEIIDDVFSFGGNALGLCFLGIGKLGYSITGNTKFRQGTIEISQTYGGVEGLTDILKADEEMFGESTALTVGIKVSEAADITSDAIGVVTDAKDFFEDPSSIVDKSFGFETSVSTTKKADMIDEYKDNYVHWQTVERHIKKQYHYNTVKNIDTIYKYMDNAWDLFDEAGIESGKSKAIEGVIETGAGSYINLLGTWGDAYDFGEDLASYVPSLCTSS